MLQGYSNDIDKEEAVEPRHIIYCQTNHPSRVQANILSNLRPRDRFEPHDVATRANYRIAHNLATMYTIAHYLAREQC